MNPNNGELLAVANWPTFNPNAASAGTPAESRMNRAVSALYEPGSTFKLITLAAAFDQGITNPDEVFDCENGATYVAGHKIHDHKRFGLLTVARHSCAIERCGRHQDRRTAWARQNFTITSTHLDLARPPGSTCPAKAADFCGRW